MNLKRNGHQVPRACFLSCPRGALAHATNMTRKRWRRKFRSQKLLSPSHPIPHLRNANPQILTVYLPYGVGFSVSARSTAEYARVSLYSHVPMPCRGMSTFGAMLTVGMPPRGVPASAVAAEAVARKVSAFLMVLV